MGGATLYGLLGSVCVADFVPRKGNCSEPPTAMVPGTEPFPVRNITCAHRTRAARQAFLSGEVCVYRALLAMRMTGTAAKTSGRSI